MVSAVEKSVVSRLLEVMGIPVYISDGETKQLMMTDSCIRSELTALLGEEVYAGGVLNKSLLASYLFGSPEHAGQINGIVHPRVKRGFSGSGFVSVRHAGWQESSLLF